MTWCLDKVATTGQDGYVAWRIGPAAPYERLAADAPPLPRVATLEFAAKANVQDLLNRAIALLSKDDPKIQQNQLPTAFTRIDQVYETLTNVTLRTGDRFFTLLREQPEFRDAVRRILIGGPCAAPAVPPASSPVGGPVDVVVGIIDDGLPLAHSRFRTAPTETRIRHALIQGSVAPDDTSQDLWLTKPDIDGFLETAKDAAGRVDEDRFYQLAGLTRRIYGGPRTYGRRASHGAHVMDLAAGLEMGDPTGARRPIVAVQLPVETTLDTSGGHLLPHVQRGIDFILDRAREMTAGGAPPPVVINFSYGTAAGPHDGTHTLEAGLDRAVRQYPEGRLAIVLPAGNGHQARRHARAFFNSAQPPAGLPEHERRRQFHAGAGPVELAMRVQPDDATSSYLEVWVPDAANRQTSRVSVTVTPPGRDAPRGTLPETSATALQWTRDGDPVARLDYAVDPANGRGRFLLALLPTFRHAPSTALPPAGVWRIGIDGSGLRPDQEVLAWIQRDDTPFGYRVRGRQAYFELPDYQRFDALGRPAADDRADAPVKRAGALNGIATGEKTVVVGGYQVGDGELARYSAGGPVPTAVRDGPDIAAASDVSAALPGLLGAGTRSGRRVRLNGTSVAAPQIARRIADGFADGTIQGPNDVQTFVRQLASESDGRPAGTVDRVRAGAGYAPQRPERVPRRGRV